MYTPSNNSIVQVTLFGVMNNQQWMNVIHFRPNDPPAGEIPDGEVNLDELVALIDVADDGWSAKRCVYTSEEMHISGIRAQYISPLRWAYKDYAPSEEVGTQPGDQAPQNLAAVGVFQCDETGDLAQGTIHIPGLTADDVADGFIGGIVKGHIASEIEMLLQTFTPAGSSLDYRRIIYNREAPTTSLYCTHGKVMEQARVMRRRTVGLGI